MFTTALVMIARNEAASIEACLASVRPWVDRMVVVDTGSTDDTVRRAQAAGAEVGHFPWVDDFSAARNHALSLAAVDWAVVLDADEIVVAGGPELVALRALQPDFVGAIRVESAFGSGVQASSASSWISRVLPGALRYAGRIHEAPVHQLAMRKLAVHVAHAGYRPQAMAGKKGRNARLLQMALADKPGDGYLLYQMGKEHAVYEDFEAAARCFAQADAALPPGLSLAHDLLLRWLFALKKTGQHAQAMQLAEARMALWEHSPDYWFVLGDVLLDWACEEPAQADALLPLIEASWLRCLDIGERPDLEGAVHGRGSHLVATNLAVFYDGIGRSDEARRYRALAAADTAKPA